MNLKKKNRAVTDDSEESTDSDATVYNARTHKGKSRVTTSNGNTARRGRPPNRQAAKRRRISDSSDRDSPQPGPSGLGNRGSSEDSDFKLSEKESASVDSDFEPATPTPTPRRRGRPPKTDKKTNKSVNGGTPQPGPSRLGNRGSSEDSDVNLSEKESASVDSDFEQVAPTPRKRGRPPKTDKKNNMSVNGVSSSKNIGNHSRVNSSGQKASSPQPGPSNRYSSGSSDVDQGAKETGSIDSDYEPESGASLQKRGRSPKTLDKTQLKKPNKSLNGTISSSVSKKVVDPKLVESLAQKLVFFLLVEDQKKYAIKRKAISAYVFKDTNHLKLYNVVIVKANSILRKVYGMELMQVENEKDSYLLINSLNKDLGIQDYVELSELKQQQRGLILYLLTVIFMNENTITEDELTKCLKPLGIDLTSRRLHPIFGDVKKYITIELVKQMYLSYELISKDPICYEIKWGIRAEQEFDKRELLQFASQVMGNTPEDWRIQFKDAEDSANPS